MYQGQPVLVFWVGLDEDGARGARHEGDHRQVLPADHLPLLYVVPFAVLERYVIPQLHLEVSGERLRQGDCPSGEFQGPRDLSVPPGAGEVCWIDEQYLSFQFHSKQVVLLKQLRPEGPVEDRRVGHAWILLQGLLEFTRVAAFRVHCVVAADACQEAFKGGSSRGVDGDERP